MNTLEKDHSWHSCSYARTGEVQPSDRIQQYCCANTTVTEQPNANLANLVHWDTEEIDLVAILGENTMKGKKAQEPTQCSMCEFYEKK